MKQNHLLITFLLVIPPGDMQYMPMYPAPQPYFYPVPVVPPPMLYPPPVGIRVAEPIEIPTTNRWTTTTARTTTQADPGEDVLVAMPVMYSLQPPSPAFCPVKPRPPYCPPCPVCVCAMPPCVPAYFTYCAAAPVPVPYGYG